MSEVWSKPSPILKAIADGEINCLDPGWMTQGLYSWLQTFDEVEITTLSGCPIYSHRRMEIAFSVTA